MEKQSTQEKTPFWITEHRLLMTVLTVQERLAIFTKNVIYFTGKDQTEPAFRNHLIGSTNETNGSLLDLATMLNDYVTQLERETLEEKWEIKS